MKVSSVAFKRLGVRGTSRSQQVHDHRVLPCSKVSIQVPQFAEMHAALICARRIIYSTTSSSYAPRVVFSPVCWMAQVQCAVGRGGRRAGSPVLEAVSRLHTAKQRSAPSCWTRHMIGGRFLSS